MKPVTVSTRDREYNVLVGSGLIDRVGAEIAKSLEPSRCAIISDEVVAPLFADRLTTSLSSAGFDSTLITIPSGEKSKSLEQAGAICERMATAGLDRSSFVVALGGGVVGDLAGFVAAIYHRGIPYVQVPTTLLAQVDSSIGGKTAVNTAAGKNLIGALHHPVLVIADIDLLRDIAGTRVQPGFRRDHQARDHSRRGVVRHAANLSIENAIWNRSLGEMSRSRRSSSRRMNEMSNGERALLNFGHTVGHAIERAGDYREFLHGEAISLGIVAACDISVRKTGLPENERAKVDRVAREISSADAIAAEYFAREDSGSASVRQKIRARSGALRRHAEDRLGAANE